MIYMLYLNMFSFMYIGYRGSPFSRSESRLLLFNEFMLHIISFHMIFFAGLAPDAKTQEQLGYSMIFSILFMTLVSFFEIFAMIAHSLKLLFLKYYYRY
jgi:hypothetical protein